MVYFHGGGFCIESTFSPLYHNYLNSLSSQARTLVVSVEYRLAPEHPLPAAYDDCWYALNWVASHAHMASFGSSNGEPWIRDYADFSRVFLGGDSAGGNITHHMALRVGNQGLANGSIHQINGMILFHPFFWGKDRMGGEVTKLDNQLNPVLADKLWAVVCPGSSGPDDPWINPVHNPRMSKLGCERVVVFVAEKDFL